MTCVDLECGSGSSSSTVNPDGKDENICFSKSGEVSCDSQFTLDAGGSNHADSEVGQVMHAGRESSVVGSVCIIDIENGVDEVRISLGTMERECRICMLSLDSESGIAFESGCSCKNELGAAHQHCAEQWFKTKGNKICEICKSIAQNVVIPNDIQSRQHICGVNRFSTNAVSMLPNSFSPDEETDGLVWSDEEPGCCFWVCMGIVAACSLFMFIVLFYSLCAHL